MLNGSSFYAVTGVGSVLNGSSFYAVTGVGSLFFELTSLSVDDLTKVGSLLYEISYNVEWILILYPNGIPAVIT